MISMASVFMAQELFVARGLKTDQSFLLLIFLMVQFVAIFGALFFERLAYAINTKNAILVSLVFWAGVVIYGYGFLHTTNQSLGDGSGNRDRAGRFPGAFAFALLANDSGRTERLRSLVFMKFRSAALPGWGRSCLARWWRPPNPTGRRCCR